MTLIRHDNSCSTTTERVWTLIHYSTLRGNLGPNILHASNVLINVLLLSYVYSTGKWFFFSSLLNLSFSYIFKL